MLRHQRPVPVVSESVIEDTQTLIPPHTHKRSRVLELLRDGREEAVVDAREVSQVEDVVKLGGSGR